jgi:hypothetical protein
MKIVITIVLLIINSTVFAQLDLVLKVDSHTTNSIPTISSTTSFSLSVQAGKPSKLVIFDKKVVKFEINDLKMEIFTETPLITFSFNKANCTLLLIKSKQKYILRIDKNGNREEFMGDYY